MVFKMDKIKIFKIATVPISLKILIKGQLKYLSENGFEVYTISSNGSEVEYLYKTEKIKKHFSIELCRGISIFKDLIAIFQCFRLIKKYQPEIVHTYTPKAGMVGMVASFLAGTKVRMHNVTGLPLIESSGLKKQLLILVEKITYLCATNVYVNSVGLKRFINEKISKDSKIKILGFGSTNGVDEIHFQKTNELQIDSENLKMELNISEKDFVWIFVGRLVKDKGICELIEAFEYCSERYLNMKLLLVGDFEHDLYPLPENTLFKLRNIKNIISVGFQSDVRPFLNLSSCLLFPSYREGLPNVPLQAACLSLPIIASNINGCNEIIEDKINGILIEPKNVQDLISSMILIYDNIILREKIASNSRILVLNKYRQTKVWDSLLMEYKEILSKNLM